jgi:protein O-mannosyl-transferase
MADRAGRLSDASRMTPRARRKPNPLPTRPRPPAPTGLAVAVLCLITALAYANSFHAGFVLDSHALIIEDARVHAATAGNLANILHHSYWWPLFETALYRPVTTLSYLFNYAILGNADRPAGYHAVNLLLHLANVLLVYLLARRVLARAAEASGPTAEERSSNPLMRAAPLFVAAGWAVHPLSTEAVTNIVGRADLLAALGVLAAFYAYLRMGDAGGRPRLLWMLGVMGATTVGVLSKENAVAVAGVAVVWDLMFRERGRSIATLATRWLVFAPPLLLMWVLRVSALPAAVPPVPFVDNPIVGAGFVRGRLTALAVIGRYVWLLIWPAHLSPDYSYNQIPLASGSLQDWLAWATAGGLLAATAVAWTRSRLACFALVCFFITLLPAANLVFPTGTIMGERLMYLPSIGLIAALVALVVRGVRLSGRPVVARPVAAGVLVLAIAALGVRTWARNPDWNSEVSLWSSAVHVVPRSFKAHGALAEALYDADPSHTHLDRVIAEKERSLELLDGLDDPDDVSNPYREAATYYLEAGRYQQAASAAERYLALADPTGRVIPADVSKTELLLATAYAHLQKPDRVTDAARRASAAKPFDPDVYRVGAAALVDAGRADDAAIVLMTGFIVTGKQELRDAVIALYRGGLDGAGCAVKAGPRGAILDSSCAIVRRHLCSAGVEAVRLQRANGRADLAAQTETTMLAPLKCGG